MSSLSEFLVVRIDGQEYAVEAGRLVGMLQARNLDLKPFVPGSATRWMARVHGRALPVVVPHQLLSRKEHPLTARSCLLLVGQGEQKDPTAAQFALLADSVSRYEAVPEDLLRAAIPTDYSSAQIRLGEKWRDVLDLDRLARACSGPNPGAKPNRAG
jgi:chemotaxis signal transduction protein